MRSSQTCKHMNARLDTVADAHGGARGAPEGGEGVADDPEIVAVEQRDLAGRRRRLVAGLRDGVAGGPIRLVIAPHAGCQIDRMGCLDAEAANLVVGEGEGDIVLFGAEDRLAFVLHFDGSPSSEALSRCAPRRRKAERPKKSAEAKRMKNTMKRTELDSAQEVRIERSGLRGNRI